MGMARVHRVSKSRKAQGKCGKCEKKIKKGDPYLWWKFRYSGKYVRCTDCSPKPSETESNSKYASILEAQDAARESISSAESLEDVTSAMETFGEAIRGVASEYEEAANNIKEHFPDGNHVSEECEEKQTNLEGWADDAENFCPDEFDEEENDTDEEKESKEDKESRKEDWLSQICSDAEDIVENNPL